MMRSGLVFLVPINLGDNQTKIKAEDDGILTANEISI